MHDFLSHFIRALGDSAGSTFLTAIGAAAIWLRSKQLKRRKKLPPAEDSRQSELIHSRLAVGLDRIHADRMYLCKIRNGSYYQDGASVQYYDRTHESVRGGVEYEAKKWSNILTSTVPEQTKLISQPGPSFTRVADIPAGKFRWMLAGSNVKCIALCAIMQGHEWAAFLGADWMTEVPRPENIDEFVELAGTIGQMLAET